MADAPAVAASGAGALWQLAAIAVGAFAVGSIPFGVVVSRAFFGRDIRSAGSGNIGAANALRTLGKAGGAAVLLLDALKGFVPAWLALSLAGRGDGALQAAPVLAGAVAGLAALLGHCYSPWLRLRGGKGVATHLGVLFALWWPAGIAFVAAWAAVGLTSGYSSAGSLAATLVAVAALWLGLGPLGFGYGAAAALVIFWRHRENIARLRAGTENPMNLVKKRTST